MYSWVTSHWVTEETREENDDFLKSGSTTYQNLWGTGKTSVEFLTTTAMLGNHSGAGNGSSQ